MVLELRSDPTKKVVVIIANNRIKRPHHHSYASCFFCKGNEKMTPKTTFALPDEKNWVVRSFRNQFPVVKPSSKKAFGEHEVIVETDVHEKLFQDLGEKEGELVFSIYKHRFEALGKRKGIKTVCLIKNHGKDGGASVSHEHAQIISLSVVPPFIEDEAKKLRKNGKCIFCSLAGEKKWRLAENKSFIAVCPPFARSSYEIWLICRRHAKSISELSAEEGRDLMGLLKDCIRRIYPKTESYNLAFHNAPLGKDFHFHVEIYPRTEKYAGLELGFSVVVNPRSEKDVLRELK
ncbi:DUF4931 domain-containing protein [Candidatus Micrarchaeota archaeon]|nr:DUF4931 domain-containing protein [Candidatus Micrarchaeota archaeon]